MPEWAQAASELKGVVPLAKVDATQHDELGSKYGVQGYPTILFFIDGVNKPYKGLRTRSVVSKYFLFSELFDSHVCVKPSHSHNLFLTLERFEPQMSFGCFLCG
jgi:hypothetical protein